MAGGHGEARGRALALALAINLVIVVVQVAVAAATGSLGLAADAAHNATDVGALALAAWAAWLSGRPSVRHTFGRGRATVVAAAANGAALVVLSGVVAWHAVRRLGEPVEVPGRAVLVTALVAAAANLLAAAVVHRQGHGPAAGDGHRHEGHDHDHAHDHDHGPEGRAGGGRDLNHEAALVHLLTDVGTSLAVAAVGAALVVDPDLDWLDPAVSLGVGALAAWGGWRVAARAVRLLGNAVPVGLDPEDVREALGAVEGVVAVHHLHLWSHDERTAALSAHVVLPAESTLAEAQVVGDRLRSVASRRFGIGETTFQVEAETCAAPDCAPVGSPVGGARRAG